MANNTQRTMDDLYVSGARMTKRLQEHYEGYDRLFSWISYVADPPKYIYWFYPMSFSLHNPLGIRVLLATSCSDFINVTMKWLLNEHRPFWYVKAHKELGVNLHQTPQTCETGPGSPSGHVMVSTAVLYVVIYYAASYRDKRGRKRHHWMGYIAWPTYMVYLALIGASRVFIAAHFPHQIALGFMFGIVTGYCMTYFHVDSWKLREYATFSGITALTCVTLYVSLQMLGIDPQESARLALNACDDPKFVSVSTTSLYSMMRQLACPLGLGLALSRPNYEKVREGVARAPVWAKLLGGFAGVAAGKIILSLPLPRCDSLVYIMAVGQFTLFSFTVGYGIPYFLYRKYRKIHEVFTIPLKSSSDED